jgi:hypothetical protein
MLKDQADQVVAELCKRFRGREVQTRTRGNEDAREAGIAQQYDVRTWFGSTRPGAALDTQEVGELLEVAKAASSEENPVELDLHPQERDGMLMILAAFE